MDAIIAIAEMKLGGAQFSIAQTKNKDPSQN
jgi:hypothetical protein